MKYFFLSDGWTVARVWSSDGLWNETAWRRQPDIERMKICAIEQNQKFWLYRVEDAVLTVEVKPVAPTEIDRAAQTIGQVVLKRLMAAEQVLDRLGAAEASCEMKNIQSVTS